MLLFLYSIDFFTTITKRQFRVTCLNKEGTGQYANMKSITYLYSRDITCLCSRRYKYHT